jgi:hypothetical protein
LAQLAHRPYGVTDAFAAALAKEEVICTVYCAIGRIEQERSGDFPKVLL